MSLKRSVSLGFTRSINMRSTSRSKSSFHSLRSSQMVYLVSSTCGHASPTAILSVFTASFSEPSV